MRLVRPLCSYCLLLGATVCRTPSVLNCPWHLHYALLCMPFMLDCMVQGSPLWLPALTARPHSLPCAHPAVPCCAAPRCALHAELMAERGCFLVPTLVTYQQLALRGEAAGMKPELVAKVGDLVERGLQAVALARQKGECCM